MCGVGWLNRLRFRMAGSNPAPSLTFFVKELPPDNYIYVYYQFINATRNKNFGEKTIKYSIFRLDGK